MSPRSYNLGKRRAATDQTRARIIVAARDLVAAEAGLPEFSMDAVARQANVARMTVYYQFASKLGLLEALYDHLARRGQMHLLPGAFQLPDPLRALTAFIATFIGFWSSDRLVIRRLRGMAAVDPDVEKGIRARDERRRHGLRIIVARLTDHYGHPTPGEQDQAIDILQMLTSFETFDWLAAQDRTAERIGQIVEKLARTALGTSETPSLS
jgi:AcrR family transcriptional regulator